MIWISGARSRGRNRRRRAKHDEASEPLLRHKSHCAPRRLLCRGFPGSRSSWIWKLNFLISLAYCNNTIQHQASADGFGQKGSKRQPMLCSSRWTQDNQWGSSSPILPLKPNQLYRRPGAWAQATWRLEHPARVNAWKTTSCCGLKMNQLWSSAASTSNSLGLSVAPMEVPHSQWASLVVP